MLGHGFTASSTGLSASAGDTLIAENLRRSVRLLRARKPKIADINLFQHTLDIVPYSVQAISAFKVLCQTGKI